MKAVFQYRCKRSWGLFEREYPGLDPDVLSPAKLIDLAPNDILHSCDNDAHGIADLIGYRVEE